jgi:hypothetical protein
MFLSLRKKDMIAVYNNQVETMMLDHYNSLGERHRRQYAAVESKKLGYGGKAYISQLLGISRITLRRGEKELLNSSSFPCLPQHRQRISGGGRKKICEVGTIDHQSTTYGVYRRT